MTFKEGQEFKIRVRPKDDCSSFAVNVGHDCENIVCNSMSGGCWGEEHRGGSFCFQRGEEVKFYINFNSEQFYIKLPDGSMIDFPNRLGDVKYAFFGVSGDARIIGIKIK